MFRIDNVTAAPALPAPAVAGTPGYFTNGDPSTNTPRTIVDQDWFNMIQEELVAVIAAAGIALAKGDHTQLLQAITHLIAAAQPVRSWQDVTGSRVSGTEYTNSTGHEIEVFITFPDTNDSTASATVEVGGVTLVNNALYDKGDSIGSLVTSFTVPAGDTYSATVTGGTIGKWCELA